MFPATVLLFMSLPHIIFAVGEIDLNELSEQQNAVRINKCCLEDELVVDAKCRKAEQYNQSLWSPQFKDESNNNVIVKYFKFIDGLPSCKNTETRAIFDLDDTQDKLNLLSDGRLQHVISLDTTKDVSSNQIGLHDSISIAEKQSYYIHIQNMYCMDKVFMTKNNVSGNYALVCVPEVKFNWKDPSFLLKKVLNPIFHGISIALYLIIAIIYFILPTLRDLAGNIITTINVCLIVSQAADFVRIFTEYSNHISFFITDTILYVSLLGAFFWLNSFGFYIWKTFKSRNVFLRVTDMRKYCYYSVFVWLSVIVMAAMAIFAHFFLDTGPKLLLDEGADQETIGWLGIAIFFTPIAFTIIINLFFYVTTLKVIKRINVYGRIHHKLKGCFNLFVQLFLIMTLAWLFLLLSWLNFDGLYYAHIVINMLQAILIFYVCIINQSHVTFLLRKSCCYAEPIPTGEWGDEMTHMNGGY